MLLRFELYGRIGERWARWARTETEAQMLVARASPGSARYLRCDGSLPSVHEAVRAADAINAELERHDRRTPYTTRLRTECLAADLRETPESERRRAAFRVIEGGAP